MNEKISKIYELLKRIDEAKKELELLVSCDKECCKKKAERVYKKNELIQNNEVPYMVMSGSAQWNDYINSKPLLDLKHVIKLVNFDKIILSQAVYDTLNKHPDILSKFGEVVEMDGIVNGSPVSVVFGKQISRQDIGNCVIFEKDGELVYQIFQPIA